MDNSFLPYYLPTSALLFSIGLALVVVKRNIIVVLMGIELMLNAANVNLVAFSKNDPSLQGLQGSRPARGRVATLLLPARPLQPQWLS